MKEDEVYDSINRIHDKIDMMSKRQEEIQASILFIESRHKYACPGEDAKEQIDQFMPMLEKANMIYKYPKVFIAAGIGSIVILLVSGLLTLGIIQKKAEAIISSNIHKVKTEGK